MKWVSVLQDFTFSLRHQSSNLNKVVNALSRRVTLLSTIHTHVLGFDNLYELYSGDSSFEQIYAQLSKGGKQGNFIIINGYLFHGLQLCIPVFSLYEHIIHELYCDGYFGWDKTLALVLSDYYQPKLSSQVSNFVKRCVICQRSQGALTNARLHTPLAVPNTLFLDVSVDFVLSLPHTQQTLILLLLIDSQRCPISQLTERPWIHLRLPNFTLMRWFICMEFLGPSLQIGM